MTYRAGVSPGLSAFGFAPCEPHIYCDEPGCGVTEVATTRYGLPKSWLRERRAPKGWQLIRREDEETGVLHRLDYCPKHRKHRKT